MAHIIPAQVVFDREGDEPPKLILEEGGSDLGELIAERGIEIEQESGDFMDEFPALGQDNHGSESPESLDSDQPEPKPLNGFQKCMSEQLLRPPESEPLTRPENQHRFREAARACKIRRQEEAAQQDI